MTKITEIDITPVRVPLDKPMAAAGKVFRYRDYLLVELTCADGSMGIGFSYVGTGGGRAAALAVQELLVPEAMGADPLSVEAIWERMYRATLIQGRAGLVMNGLSAIDIALWDRNARHAGLPLYRHCGSDERMTVPAYASGGYYADDKGLDELAAEIAGYKAQGFTAVKIKTGRLSVKEEEQRVQMVREVIGSDAKLMLDLYNAFNTLAEAMPYIEMYRQFKPYWFEDPFMPDDLDNLARLAQRVPEPLATGEFYSNALSFEQLMRAGAAQIIQPEAPRCGGISALRRVANAALAHGVAVCPCWYHQIHSQLLPSLANGLFVECFVDNSIFNFSQLIDADFVIQDGALVLPQRAGLGFDFRPEAVREFRLA